MPHDHNSLTMTKAPRQRSPAEGSDAEPARRATRPKPTKPKPTPPPTDDGLAVKIGRLLVRFMKQAGPADLEEAARPRPRVTRPAGETRPVIRPGEKPREGTKISPPGKARLKPMPTRSPGPKAPTGEPAVRPGGSARPLPSPLSTEARRTIPTDVAPIVRPVERPGPAIAFPDRPAAIFPGLGWARPGPEAATDETIESDDSESPESPIESDEAFEKVEEKPNRSRWTPTIRRYAAIIEQTLIEFGAPCQVVHAETGPMILRFGVSPGYLQKPSRGDQPARRERVRTARIV